MINLKEDIQKKTEKNKDGYNLFNFQIFPDFTDDVDIKEIVNNYNDKFSEGWNK